jgi:AcrR family transcriptional regulator
MFEGGRALNKPTRQRREPGNKEPAKGKAAARVNRLAGKGSAVPGASGRGPAAQPRPKTARGEATRRAILAAAEIVIGRQGYSEASIGSITREAGVAQGTFYIYFAGKDEVFSELVAEMGRMLRHVIAEATAGYDDRLEAEREGLRAFLTFVSDHPELYRIVQEAQFVDPAAYRAYFGTFAQGYREGLEKAVREKTISAGDAEIRAWALMGIARALGELQVVFNGGHAIDTLVDTAHDLIENGLRAHEPRNANDHD